MSANQAPTHNETADLDHWFDRRFEEKMAEREAAYTPSVTIIASKGTLDMAYPPFILASTAAALGWKASIFFTFYGLALLKKKLDLKVTPLGNPAMPTLLPNSVMAIAPGFDRMYSAMMKKRMDKKGIASVEELRDLCIEADVKMIGCQMSAELFDWKHSEFIEGVVDWVGATSFLAVGQKSDVSLII
jgi:peroxiredoxin family protein